MKNFKDLNVQYTGKKFVGDKVKMTKILNREIVIHDFWIKNSTCYEGRGTGKCLCLQLSLADEKHILFTGASRLIEAIEQAPSSFFPFTTTIVKAENDGYEFS